MKKVKQKWPTIAHVAAALFWRAPTIDGGPTRCALYVWPTRTSDETLPQWAVEIGAPDETYLGAYAACSHLERGYTYNKGRAVAKELLAMVKQGVPWGARQRAPTAAAQEG